MPARKIHNQDSGDAGDHDH